MVCVLDPVIRGRRSSQCQLVRHSGSEPQAHLAPLPVVTLEHRRLIENQAGEVTVGRVVAESVVVGDPEPSAWLGQPLGEVFSSYLFDGQLAAVELLRLGNSLPDDHQRADDQRRLVWTRLPHVAGELQKHQRFPKPAVGENRKLPLLNRRPHDVPLVVEQARLGPISDRGRLFGVNPEQRCVLVWDNSNTPVNFVPRELLDGDEAPISVNRVVEMNFDIAHVLTSPSASRSCRQRKISASRAPSRSSLSSVFRYRSQAAASRMMY